MLRTVLLIAIFFISTFNIAQAPPQGFNYSSVIRGNNGQALPNSIVSVRLSILLGSPNGVVTYQEVHIDTTNQFGVLNLEIGMGYPVTGTFQGIQWGAGNHYLQTELDDQGSNDFQLMGVAQFLSVPYALYCGNANSTSYSDTSATNELQTLSLSNDTLYLSDGGNVILPIPTNVSQLNNDAGYITDNNDADANPSNELQFLSISNDTLFLTNGGFVKLPVAYSGTNTDSQQLTLNYDTLSISNGNSVVVPPLSNDYTISKLVTVNSASLSNVPDGWKPVPYTSPNDTLQLQLNITSTNDTYLVYSSFFMSYLESSASARSALWVINSGGSTSQNLALEAWSHSNGALQAGYSGVSIVTGLPPGVYTLRLMSYVDGAVSPGTRTFSGTRHLLIRKV